MSKRYRTTQYASLSLVIMQVGGYEWDRDLDRDQREAKAKTEYEKLDMPKHLECNSIQQACVSKRDYLAKKAYAKRPKDMDGTKKTRAFELAFEDPLYKAVFTPVVSTTIGATNAYRVEWQTQPLTQEGPRNLVFEVLHPLYKGLKAIVASHGPFVAQATTMRLHVSSSEHPGVSYTCYCTPETWSYTVMDKLWDGLNKQLAIEQDLHRGLLLHLSFINKRWS